MIKVSIEFTEGAHPEATKPKCCYVKHKDIFVTVWMGWDVVVSETREGVGHSILLRHFTCKPTQKQIRKMKKGLWNE